MIVPYLQVQRQLSNPRGRGPHADPGGLGAGLLVARRGGTVASDARMLRIGAFTERLRAEAARFLAEDFRGAFKGQDIPQCGLEPTSPLQEQ